MNGIVADQVQRYVGAIMDQTAIAHDQGKTHGQTWPKGAVPMPAALDDIAERCNVQGVFNLMGRHAEVVQTFRVQVGSAHHANAVAAPVFVPGDPHATAPNVCVFVKQFNIALLNVVVLSVKLRTFEGPQLVGVARGRMPGAQAVGDKAKVLGWTG